MPSFVERLWDARDAAHLGRRDRAAGRYLAFVPDELGRTLPPIGPEAQSAAEDALAVLARADERIGSHGAYLNHLLIRSESISSSWIEGNRITPKRLAIAETLDTGSRVALDVIGNVRATEAAIAALADRDRRVTAADIVELQHVIEPTLPPGLRTEQNWVGGPGWSPLRAEFVPPPETDVPRLVDDLAAFVTDTTGNPVVRAAIAHAQFETIHPFADGNGRTGRALVQLVLRRRGLATRVLPPVSLVLATWAGDYIDGLTATRYRGPAAGKDAQAGLNLWVGRFAGACKRAVKDAASFEQRIEQIQRQWRTQLGPVRKNSSADR